MKKHLAQLVTSGPFALIGATGLSGGAGYLITLLAGVELGPSAYLAFGVLWSSLFFTVGTLNGLQQEVARATHPSGHRPADRVVRDVVAPIAVLVALATVGTSFVWVPVIFNMHQLWLSIPVGLGLAGHTVTTTLIGTLHGLRRSRLIAGAIVLDSLLRFGLVLAVIATTHSLGPISWALVFPYFVMPFLIWRFARRDLAHTRVDVTRLQLVWHASSTLLASAATGSLVSGISVLVAAAGRDVPPAHVGAVVFAINITRAPLIIVVAAIQSLIIVRFRDRTDWRRLLALLLAAVFAAGVLLAVVAAAIGPQIIGALLHRQTLDALSLAVIVGSGGLVAMMTVTGSAALSRGHHRGFTVGWVLAAATTIVALFAFPQFDEALRVALISGPIVGLLVHLTVIAKDRQASLGNSVSEPSLTEL